MLVCSKCNSDQVHVLAWVDANTKEFVEWHQGADVLDERGWCNSCGAQVDVKYLPDSLWQKKYGKKDESENV